MDNKNNFYKYEDRSDISAERYYGKKKTMPFFVVLFCVIGILVISASSAYVGVLIASRISNNKVDNKVVIYKPEKPTDVPIKDGEKLTVAGVAAKVSDSVVTITTETGLGNLNSGRGTFNCVGSGLIWSESGYIVTNAHAIRDAIAIKVVFSGGTSVDATVYSQDFVSDIAILKINATGLSPITIGDSKKLVAGQEIVAVSNAPESENGISVTNGIISAVCINTSNDNNCMKLLQTTAVIKQSHAGGGLFDMNGNLIGIVNSRALVSPVEGLTYGIPASFAESVVQDLFELGFVRGRVDTDILTLEEVDITTGSMVTQRGLLVAKVNTLNSEFKVNDYIITLDNISLSTISNWKARLFRHEIGDKVVVCVKRDGKVIAINYTIEEKKSK